MMGRTLMNSHRPFANAASLTVRVMLVLLAAMMVNAGWTASSRADAVVIITPFAGKAPAQDKTRLAKTLALQLEQAGHIPIQLPIEKTPEQSSPSSARAMREIAHSHRAQWVLTLQLNPRQVLEETASREAQTQYTLFLGVSNANAERFETHTLSLEELDSAPALSELLERILLSTPVKQKPSPPPSNSEDSVASKLSLGRLNLHPAPHCYHREKPWHLQLGGGLNDVLIHEDRVRGGALGNLALRLGYALEGHLSGLDLRAGLDLWLGASTGIAAFLGTVYAWALPTPSPLFLGASAEMGIYGAFSGNRVAQFMLRLSPLLHWQGVAPFYLELALPELSVLSANGGVLSLGGSLRIGLHL